MRRTPRGGSGTGHGHVAQRPDVLGISDIKEITWDDYYSQRDTVEFCQREPHLVTIHNENSGKHKIDEIKNFDFLFFAFLFWVVNLVTIFKVPCSKNFLFWHYCLFVPE